MFVIQTGIFFTPQSKSNHVKFKMWSYGSTHTLTSEPSERLVYDPNDWFTIYSHTYHCSHILHQILCGERKG